MLQTLEILRLILTLLPIVVEAVQKMEELIPDKGMGSVKFALVMESIKNTLQVSEDTLKYVETLINTVVNVFNKFGVFKK